MIGEPEIRYAAFDEYLRQGEPSKREAAFAWSTAIGLQDVDRLKTSKHAWYFRNALVRANYKNAAQGIDYTFTYIERFFRNLLLGEQWVLKSRYLFVNPPAEYREQPRLDTPPQVDPSSYPSTYPSSCPSSSVVTRLNTNGKFYTNDASIIDIVREVGNEELTIKELMTRRQFKDRMSFLENHLNPALRSRFLRRKYPNSPNLPRQRYLLTLKGQMLYEAIVKPIE